MTQDSDIWTLTLPCTRHEAEAATLADDALWMLDNPPTLTAREIDPANPDGWEVTAYFSATPSQDEVNAVLALLPGGLNTPYHLEKLGDADWVTLSQQGLAPVHAGRFFVHSASFDGPIPADATPFIIEASRAFGTGNHETTSRCLTMIDQIHASGAAFSHIADIGTGTGLLAFAARHLWPNACVMASDIDPVSIEIVEENAAVNDIPIGNAAGEIALCVASGTDHDVIQERAPYDLILANILAGPLIELAPALSDLLRPGGVLVLAGLLDRQVEAISTAYAEHGVTLAEAIAGEWPCLRLIKTQELDPSRPSRARMRTSQPPGDFGTW